MAILLPKVLQSSVLILREQIEVAGAGSTQCQHEKDALRAEMPPILCQLVIVLADEEAFGRWL